MTQLTTAVEESFANRELVNLILERKYRYKFTSRQSECVLLGRSQSFRGAFSEKKQILLSNQALGDKNISLLKFLSNGYDFYIK